MSRSRSRTTERSTRVAWYFFVALTLFASLGAASASCGGTAEEKKDTTTATSTTTTQDTFATSACWMSMESTCAGDIAACEGEPDCHEYLACLKACPASGMEVDQACEGVCEAKPIGAGKAAKDALSTCRKDACGTKADAGTDGGDPVAFLTQQCESYSDPNACTVCDHQRCCDSRAKCGPGSACASLQECVATCSGGSTMQYASCLASCADTNTEGSAAYGELTACRAYNCVSAAGPCGGYNAACQGCLFDTCLAETAACLADARCFQLYVCVSDHPVGSPIDEYIKDCTTKYPSTVAAKDLFDDLVLCQKGCTPPCPPPG